MFNPFEEEEREQRAKEEIEENKNKIFVIDDANKKDVEKLKNQLYQNKSKRLNLIDSITNKIEKELETRDLSEVSTGQLMTMLLKFNEQAKKENPSLEISQGKKKYSGAFEGQKITL